jgi:hypothetical protein
MHSDWRLDQTLGHKAARGLYHPRRPLRRKGPESGDRAFFPIGLLSVKARAVPEVLFA